jgi:hypothetical protein
MGCRLEQKAAMHGCELKRREPRHTWEIIPTTPNPAGLTARTAPWIAAALKEEQLGKVRPAAAAAGALQGSAEQSVRRGLKKLIAALPLSKDEDERMSCVVEAVSNAIARAPQSGAWTVAWAKPVGSLKKRTNLAGT